MIIPTVRNNIVPKIIAITATIRSGKLLPEDVGNVRDKRRKTSPTKKIMPSPKERMFVRLFEGIARFIRAMDSRKSSSLIIPFSSTGYFESYSLLSHPSEKNQ